MAAVHSVHLDHCVIHVSDWNKSNDFYRQVLQAEIVSANGRISYRFGKVQLNVHGPGVVAGPLAKVPVAPGGSDLCFVWDGPIAEAAEHLRNHGVTIEIGPVSRAGAQGIGKSVYFRDPDGSLLELISYQS
jgi:catechol 2,3-dioxygenase-like lactoylglutathione lyase family enzyme